MSLHKMCGFADVVSRKRVGAGDVCGPEQHKEEGTGPHEVEATGPPKDSLGPAEPHEDEAAEPPQPQDEQDEAAERQQDEAEEDAVLEKGSKQAMQDSSRRRKLWDSLTKRFTTMRVYLRGGDGHSKTRIRFRDYPRPSTEAAL